MEPKQLPRGVPDGAQSQRQSKRKSTALALVSDYTKRVAHELDDKHSAWVILRRNDALQYSIGPEPEPEPMYLIKPNNMAMLSDYDNIEENYQRMLESRRRLEVKLTKANSDKARLIANYSASRFFAHTNTIKAELAYVEMVQRRLKEVRNNIRSVLRDTEMLARLDVEPSIAALGELMGIVHQALRKNDIQVLRNGLHDNNERLRNIITDILKKAEQEVISDTDARVVVDGFIARQWELR